MTKMRGAHWLRPNYRAQARSPVGLDENETDFSETHRKKKIMKILLTKNIIFYESL